MSHPSRVRELKQMAGAVEDSEVASHPSRVRELKHPPPLGGSRAVQSHPSRVRELKQISNRTDGIGLAVAPLPGA